MERGLKHAQNGFSCKGLYTIYTSGTTGDPKGILRDNSHAVTLKWTMCALRPLHISYQDYHMLG